MGPCRYLVHDIFAYPVKVTPNSSCSYCHSVLYCAMSHIYPAFLHRGLMVGPSL